MMELADFYPAPNDLLQSEVRVLNYLRNDPYIKAEHGQFARDAGICYGQQRDARTGFAFCSDLDVWHEPMHRGRRDSRGRTKHKANVRLTVAAHIRVCNRVFTSITYCLAVCRLRPERVTILRKFHFDVVGGSSVKRGSQPHPRCHLQYCGEMLPRMATMGCRQTQLDQMHPWLSEPRILFWPMSLALLIDMALHEFPNERSARFRASSEWREIVRSQESLVLRPFYEKCMEVVGDPRGEKRTLADVFYVD